MPDNKLPQRTLATTFWLASFFTLIFSIRGQSGIAVGLAIGAAISLFSLWTLIVTVPRFAKPGNAFAKFWMAMIWVAKLPIYAITLNFAMTSRTVEPFAVFVGAAMVPVVLVLKVVGYQMVQRVAVPEGE